MTDVVTSASGTGTDPVNGSIITYVTKMGDKQKIAPDINDYVPSGTLFARLDTRFDEHYGGGPSGLP